MLKARPPTGSRVIGAAHTHACSKSAFLSLKAADCNGNDCSFDELAGKVTIVINIADASDQQPQNINNIKELVQLYKECRHRGLEVVAFPSEQRGCNRVATVRNVAAWRDRMGIHFHVMQKVELNGSQQHPVYSLLKQRGSDIRGHFHTAFIVTCGEERCTIHRFNGKPPRALRSHVEEWLCDVAE